MSERDSFPPGTPSWVDLGSPDPDASAAFYGALFGWTIGDGAYRMCTLRDRPVAAISTAEADGVPWWTTYVTVTSAADTATAVRAAGGTVLANPFDAAAGAGTLPT